MQIVAPSLGAQDGGANKAFGIIDKLFCADRQLFVDVNELAPTDPRNVCMRRLHKIRL